MTTNGAEQQRRSITGITISGFKSLRDETSVEIRPLTILAGANSSGKSSIIQPLLLMKQTLELDYDSGVFHLDGPNVHFTEVKQFFSDTRLDRIDNTDSVDFNVGIEVGDTTRLTNKYVKTSTKQGVRVVETTYQEPGHELRLWENMSHDDLYRQLPVEFDKFKSSVERISIGGEAFWYAAQNRCFLYPSLRHANGQPAIEGDPLPLRVFPLFQFKHTIQEVIHVPGLRGNPRRSYPMTFTTGPRFEGTFDKYFASIIAEGTSTEVIFPLVEWSELLNIARGFETSTTGEIEVTIKIQDQGGTFNIADVGFGVSQVLPVLVALLVAQPGQLVYLEQPELHLHPRAQVALATILADAANRGVRVVAETHSSLLLLGLQTLIAEGRIEPEKVILHWFQRDDEGVTTVRSEQPDENGAYGDWPEDFADVELDAQKHYMDAVAAREMGT